MDHLQYYQLYFQPGIMEIRRYAESVEKLLSEHSKNIWETIQIPTSGMTDEQKEHLYEEYYCSETYERENTFPRILRYSLFVHSYLFFERKLISIAKQYQETRKLQLSPSDLNHKGIEQARVYLKKVLSIPFPDTGSTWEDIRTLNIIRNRIVHNEGELPEEGQKDFERIERLVKKWHGDISREYPEVELHKTFVFRVLDTFDTFFTELFTSLPSA